jgi:hypothetical protein
VHLSQLAGAALLKPSHLMFHHKSAVTKITDRLRFNDGSQGLRMTVSLCNLIP